jgi:hypothetical protein
MVEAIGIASRIGPIAERGSGPALGHEVALGLSIFPVGANLGAGFWALFEYSHQVFQLENRRISRRLEERTHVSNDLLPVDYLESVLHNPPPIVSGQWLCIPACLLQRIVEQG